MEQYNLFYSRILSRVFDLENQVKRLKCELGQDTFSYQCAYEALLDNRRWLDILEGNYDEYIPVKKDYRSLL